MKIGQKLRHFRRNKKLSTTELANLSGISQSSVSIIEKDGRSPTLDTVEKLCRALGISIIDLLPEDIQEMQQTKAVNVQEHQLLSYYRGLTKKQKEAILLLFETLNLKE